MVGATGLDLLKSWKYLSVDDIPMFAVGFITSFIVAMLAVVTFLKLLEKIGLKPFCILSHFVSCLIYTFRIAIDSYKSHIIKPIFKLKYRFFIHFTSVLLEYSIVAIPLNILQALLAFTVRHNLKIKHPSINLDVYWTMLYRDRIFL